MHEISLCEMILQTLDEQSEIQHYRRVRSVTLEVGELAGVEIDALRFSFDVVVQGSLADQARLEIIEIPGRACCLHCSLESAVQQRYQICPGCGHYQLQIIDGEQMRIKELEVE